MRPAPPEGHGAAPSTERDRAAVVDTTWFGATGIQAEVAAEEAPPPYASPLVARYRASDHKSITDKAAARPSSDKSRPSRVALVAWIAGGTVLAAAVIVGLVVYLTGGTTLPPAPAEAASILPSRLTGLSVELDKHPRVLEDVPYRRDGAGIVVTDPKHAGIGGYAAAIVLEPSAAGGDFQTSFETGLASDGKVGEFSDTVFDAVSFRTAEVGGTPDVTRVWWYKPYRDAVVVVYASDEATGRRIIEGLVERNSTTG